MSEISLQFDTRLVMIAKRVSISDPCRESSGSVGTFYFSHSDGINSLLGLFGLYRDDEPLRHDNFEAMADRVYQTSLTGSFSANVALVLLDCQDLPTTRIVAWHQERPVQLEKCDRLDCDWQQFLLQYQVGEG